MQEKLKQARTLAQKQSNKLRHREQAVARKIETRKNVLIGLFVVHKMPELLRSAEFAKFFKRDDERALFGFPPLPSQKPD